MGNCPSNAPAGYSVNAIANNYVAPGPQAAYPGIQGECPAISCAASQPKCGAAGGAVGSKVGCEYAPPANQIFGCSVAQCVSLACYCKPVTQPKCLPGYESYHQVTTAFVCESWSACSKIPS